MTDLSQRLANLSPQQWKMLQQRLQNRVSTSEPVAIVGMSCRFPGAPDLQAYWRLIEQGIDATGEIPADRWDVDALYDPTGEQAGKMSVRRAGLLENIDQFDPQFFGISPREAARMDPQQRLLLEVCWEALENGGIAPDGVAGSATGVFVGIGGTDYAKVPAQFDGYYRLIDAHVGTGNALSIAANRISYIFDLRGPSLAVDTACSSSTMAIHLAVQSLRNRECSMALSGGVNAILTPETTIAFSKARMLSPEGRCRPFDAGANGYVRGEGCGMLVLKRLSDALEQGDPIFAVIRATATNQDGRTSGITAPNAVSQQAVILAALAQAGLQPAQVDYVEAHGTGTPLGDPIEIEALRRVFPRSTAADRPCYVTSVKANVGHMETVSGVAGIIKVALMMQNQKIPPQLHLEALNPRISLAQSRLVIPTQPVPWPVTETPRLAGVSSFGFGGANTHVVLQAPESTQPAQQTVSDRLPLPDRTRHLVTLSGKSAAALHASAQRLAAHLEQHPALDIADLAATLNRGRAHFAHRAAIVAADGKQLAEQLAQVAAARQPRGVKSGNVHPGKRPQVAFLFTGQGAQYSDMGLGLYRTQPVFRQTLDRCNEILRERLPRPLLSVIYPGLSPEPEPGSDEIDQTQYTQPALFALEYAVATLWRHWGVEPCAVLGHSVGEYVAACIAGILSLEDALRLIAHRARLMQQLPAGGQMAAVFAPADRIASLIQERGLESTLAIAASNGPENTVISGASAAVDALLRHCETLGITAQLLRVSHAFHSQLMEPMLREFHALAAACTFHAPQIPLISNVTGQLLEEPWSADYLCQHIRGTVRFAEGMATLAGLSPDIFLEVGPAPVLTGMGRRCLSDSGAAWLPSLRPGQPDEETLLLSAAELYVAGAPLDWNAFDEPWQRQRLVLPTYPFERQRCWFDPPTAPPRGLVERTQPKPQGHPLLGDSIAMATDQRLFERRLSPESPAYLSEHRVQDSVAFPAAGYVEMALAAATQVFGPGTHVLDDLLIQQALFLPAQSDRVVQTILAAESGGSRSVEISSSPGPSENQPSWTLHAYGKVRHGSDSAGGGMRAPESYATFASRVVDVQSQQQFYETMTARKLQYGPRFRVLGQLSRSSDEALGDVQLEPAVASELAQYHLHPALGDALFQTCAGLVPAEPDGGYSPFTYMPTQVRSVRVLQQPSGRLWTYGRRHPGDAQPSPERVDGDVWLINEAGEVVAELLGVQLTRVGQLNTAGTPLADALYRVQWEPAEEPVEAAAVADQSWLIFADDTGLGDALARQLKAAGAVPVVVRPGDAFQARVAHNGDSGGFTIAVVEPTDYEQLFAALVRPGRPPLAGVVHLWSLSGDGAEPAGAGIARDVSRASESALRLIQRLVRESVVNAQPSTPWRGVWFVTRGAQKTCAEDHAIRPAQASLWGLGRVVAVEHPELRSRLIDLDPQAVPEDALAALLSELQRSSAEDQVAHRGGERRVARLQRDPQALSRRPATAASHPLPPAPFRLRFAAAGSFDSLYFEACQRPAPRGSEVEVQIAAAGLNFSDVLKAMGLYPGITDPVVPLGIECAGTVTAVGPEVQAFQVGDRVYGVAPFSFGSHARTAEYALSHTPPGMTEAEAATIPIAFMTAYYALVQLADLQPGERVLIHAGAGGVGLAAIQIAQHLGAEIFATAGSDEKRDFLRALGVRHVFSSRSLDFAEQILQVTDREGVDVVLNSLPGDVISKSLGILRAYGRFLEIGKTDIYQNRLLGLSPFQDNLSYFAIDLDRILRQRPQVIRRLFAALEKHFAAGDFRPLVATEFAAENVADAFRYMAQRKNIGKVVVALPEPGAAEAEQVTGSRTHSATTALITGGLGALGLALAEQLVEQGAEHLVLLARREPNEQQAAVIARLRERSHVAVVAGDVSQLPSLQAALQQIAAEFPPITDIYHAAGVLDDGLLFDMSASRWQRPLAPKIQGTWNLHAATLDQPIRRFVLFSSIAALLGSPGQGNYAAANAFLDAFAAYRQSLGLPATSINWGPWAGAGMATQGGTAEQLRSRGLGLIATADALEVMQRLLASETENVAVMEVDWPAMLRAVKVTRPLLSTFAGDAPGSDRAGDDQVDHEFRERIQTATAEQRDAMLQRYFTDELARIMGWDAEQIDPLQPLSELGMDSLMAMELKNNLERRLAITLPMAAFIEAPSITSLSRHAAAELASGDAESSGSPSDAHYRVLVPLKGSGTKFPWFCVHPLGGNAGCYADLAKHAPADQPVLGLWGRGADGVLEPPRTLDAMVDEYVAAITKHQPEGPYHLLGWSAGGIYAYEIARRLHHAGHAVAPLVLLDTPLPSIYDNIDLSDDARFLYDFTHFSNIFLQAQMQVTYEQLQQLSREQALQLLLSEAKREGLVAAGASTRYIERLIETSRAHVQFIKDYRLADFDHEIHLYRPAVTGALEGISGKSWGNDLGWNEQLRRPLRIHQTPGDHFTMLLGASAAELAQRLAVHANPDDSQAAITKAGEGLHA